MKIYLAVFRSRTQALDFISALKSFGIAAKAVSTPKEANVGCGISAKISESDLKRASIVAKKLKPSALVGFYSSEFRYGKNIVYRIG